MTLLILLTGSFFVIVSCGGGVGGGTPQPSAIYSNATLTGTWMTKMVIGPTTLCDGFKFDGNGNIVESYTLNPGQLPSPYNVKGDGSFTLNITSSNGPTMVAAGTLTSATIGSITSVDGTAIAGTLRKVMDLSACQGTWNGTLAGVGGLPNSFQITVDNTGTITGGSGFTPPHNGKLFAESGDVTGYLTTGAAYPQDRMQFHNGSIISGATTTITGDFETNMGVATYTLVK